MNAIRTLLVPVDANAAARLALARRLAQRLQAEVDAVHLAVPAYMELPFEVSAGAAVATMLAEVDEDRRRAARAVFDAAMAQSGMPMTWRESSDGAPVRALSQQALYADLLVLGQHDPGANLGLPSDFVESVLLASGRPALVVPYAGSFSGDFRTAIVAWKESAPSARALTAALPLLKTADAVHVLHWDSPEDDGKDDGSRIQAFLRRHGVESLLDDTRKIAISRLGDEIRIAGTAEMAGYDTSLGGATARRRCQALVERYEELFPGVADASEPRFWAGLRPSTPDNVPYIGRSRIPNLWLNAGHGTLGWTHGAGSGRAIAELLAGRVPRIGFAFRGLPSGALRPPAAALA